MYEKIHLVPFAEYDLFPGLFHPLENLNLNIDRGVFQGGKDYKVFKWNQVQFSDLICYESSLPRYARQFVQNGADILMIQANDGWLGESAGPYQHFELARLRAIENRIPVVRSGNTGISGVILPTGEVQRKVPLGIALVFMENIPLYTPGSFYSHYGDVFAVISFVIFLFLGPVSCLKKQS
jgi:apolipoprotein N-acyltransferase